MEIEVAIIGSGFSGINMAINLMKKKIDSFVIFEKSGNIGGVWRDNIYPGCTCDIKSALYSLKSEPNPDWTANFPKQQEIYAYLHSIVDKYNLHFNIRLNTQVTHLNFDETLGVWKITTNKDSFVARVVILATGPQRLAAYPKIEGIDQFGKSAFHSSQWDSNIDLKGKKVALIGTGASAIQIIPKIQPIVSSLVIFQRTPAWILPRMQRNIYNLERKVYKNFPFILKLKRELIFWHYELIGTSFLYNKVLHKILRTIFSIWLQFSIKDKLIRDKLKPRYNLGCKRILVSDNFYKSIENPKVNLVTEPIVRIKRQSIQTDKAEFEVDVLIYATGFTVADIEKYIEIKGRNNISLNDIWADNGAEAFLGMHISGFPNLCYLLGPNSGLSHSSALHAMESQVAYIIKYLEFLKNLPEKSFLDVKPEIQTRYNKKLQQKLNGTVWDSGCNSWFLNKQNKNTVIFPGTLSSFRKATKYFNIRNYDLIKC
ncbi:MAG: NAD(P)/FAD-dependent oxidoreductase [Spirosomataceae bacterium]